jgi:hypothetical protein
MWEVDNRQTRITTLEGQTKKEALVLRYLAVGVSLRCLRALLKTEDESGWS